MRKRRGHARDLESAAQRGEGQYFAIAQDGGVHVVATPYDKKLADLGGRIGGTYLAFGGGGGLGGERFRAEKMRVQRGVESKVAAAAPAGAAADRAFNKAINLSAYDGDLLTEVENGAVRLDTIKVADLPEDLKKLSLEARKQEVNRRIGERSGLKKQILELSRKRDDYVAAERKKMGSGKQVGFDTAVSSAIRKQAARRGIRF